MQACLDFSKREEFLNFCKELLELPSGEEENYLLGITVSRHIDPAFAPMEQPSALTQNEIYVRVDVLDDSFTTEIFRLKIDAFRQTPRRFPVVVAKREPARLVANIEGGTPVLKGTLGALLECSTSGTRYGLTCSHVATTKGQAVNLTDVGGSAHSSAGSVHETNYAALTGSLMPPSTAAHRSLCNPVTNTTTTVDAALISLNSGHAAQNTVRFIGRIGGVDRLAALSVGDNVEMMGSATGRCYYKVGGLAVTYKLGLVLGGSVSQVCFKNLLETYTPVTKASAFIFGAPSKPPQAGDSGSWICRSLTAPAAAPYQFAGMVIGSNGVNGFSHFVDDIETWASGLSPKVTLQPF